MAGDFLQAVRDAGLSPPETIEPGRFYRFPGDGKRRSNKAGWCKLFPDGMAGAYGDFSTGLTEAWRAARSRPLSLAEREAQREQWRHAKAEADAERERLHAEAADEATRLWQGAETAQPAHPYLVAKGIKPNGARVHGGNLLIPMRDAAGKIWNVQRIHADGKKLFLQDARVTGCYFSLGNPTDSICIVEGFATGASVHEATGRAVAVAFNTGNLESVARKLRAKYPRLRFILCADDDYRTNGNPGIAYAKEAARAVGGSIAIPDFGPERPDGATDFNDMHQLHGASLVERAIAHAMSPDAYEGTEKANAAPSAVSWPLPERLDAEEHRAPYPLEALPVGIHEAVEEVVAFVQCPPALAGCSALSALSLAGQGLANVERAPGLVGPMSLYVLAIAESGERKTTCDRKFLDGIRAWETESEEATRSDVAYSRAAIAAWEDERDGIRLAIKQAAKSGESHEADRLRLEELEKQKPQPFRVPRLVRADATPEALAWALNVGWPSGGVMSNEAGIVLGGHGMKAESVMRNLALLNSLWDGQSHRVERRGSDCYTLSGVRLTMGLAAQPETVRLFMEGTEGLARSNGFVARFLIAKPESTQGTRLFKSGHGELGLARFNARLRELLRDTPTPTESGALELPTLRLAPDAFEAWRAFHDDVERQLRNGADMAEVRDVAAKAADNAARVAALFHVYADGTAGLVSRECMARACSLVAWHLYQARAFLGEVSAPREVSNARRLDAFLVGYCRINRVGAVTRRELQNRGPIRKDGAALDAALRELEDAGRVRCLPIGKKQVRIEVNPALLTEAP